MKRIHLKAEACGKGFFYLDHVPTGKVFTGTSKNVQQDVLLIKASLEDGVCKFKRLVKLYNAEPDFQVRFVMVDKLPDAKFLEKEFRSARPKHLLIN